MKINKEQRKIVCCRSPSPKLERLPAGFYRAGVVQNGRGIYAAAYKKAMFPVTHEV
jgi:hypothetical protein